MVYYITGFDIEKKRSRQSAVVAEKDLCINSANTVTLLAELDTRNRM